MPDAGLVTLVGSNAAILVGPNCPDAFLASLREAVQSRTPLTAIVSALASAGDAPLPSFACVVREGSTARLLVRGKAAAIALDADSGKRVRLYKPQVSKWSEKLVESAVEVVLTWEENLATPVYVVFFFEQSSARKKRASVASPGPVEAAAAPPASPRVAAPPAVAAPVALSSHEPTAGETLSDWQSPPMTPPTGPVATPPKDDFDFSHLVEETQFRGVEAAAVRAQPAAPDVEVENAHIEPAFAEPEIVEPEFDWPESRDSSLSPSTQVFEDSSDKPSWTPPPLLGDAPPPEPAKLIAPPPPPPPPRDQVPPMFDQDAGLDDATVSLASLRNAQANAAMQSGNGPQVQAVLCPSGHPNSPVAPSCRICDLQIVDRAVVRTGRPSLGLLQFDDGLVVELDRSLLVGRNPKRRDGDDPSAVGLVVVPDEGRALSRTHVEIALNDWQITVVDLGSTNGTVVEAPGEPAVRLRAGEKHIVLPGTRVSLGDEIGFVIGSPHA